MKLFVKIKAWQLLLIITAPAILVIYWASLRGVLITGTVPLYLTAGIIVMNTLFILWLWSIGKLLPRIANLKKRNKLFDCSVIYMVFFLTLYFGIETLVEIDEGGVNLPDWLGILTPIAMLMGVYIIRYAAETLVEVEQQKKVSLGDYYGTFFLLWFFPLGVWFIQPRVNKLWEIYQKPE